MKHIIFSILLISLVSCQQSTNNPQDVKSIIATYNHNEISVEELSQYILTLPESQRWPNQKVKKWISKSIKDLSIYKQLISEAKLIGLESQTDFQQKMHDNKRKLFSNQYIQSHAGLIKIDNEKLLQYYNDNSDSFNLPEQRTVRHIYKQFNDNKAQAINELKQLRQRILLGENFKILASQYSDSESRHTDGYVGVVKRGDLSQEFDEIIFNLEKDIPSNVISTKEGAHVFLVERILDNKEFSFESVKLMILQQLNILESVRTTKELAEELPDSHGFVMPDQTEIRHIFESRKNQTILEIGDFILTKNQYIEKYEEIKQSLGLIQIKDLEYIVLKDIAYREIIYQYMLENKIDLIDTKKLEMLESNLLLETMGEYKMKAYLNTNPEIINDFYSKNSMRYSTPVMVDIEVLRIPLNNDINLMPELEKSSLHLNQGKTNFVELANKYDGKILKLNNQTAFKLQQINTKLLNFSFKTKKGQYSNPFTVQKVHNILHVIDYKDAQEQPLIAVRNAVINDYIKTNSAALFQKISDELTNNLVIDETAVEQYIVNNNRL